MGKRVLLCGGCFAGNMGGDAMYETFIEQFKQYDPEGEVVVLTKYPKDEVRICRERGYEVHSFTTVCRVFLGIPFFLMGSLLRTLHIPHKWLAVGPLKSYYDCDLLVDFSGISFSDFRGFLDLIINSTWFLPAFVSGIPIIKMSQSLGTYNKPTTYFFSKFCLSRIHVIVARGSASYNVTKELLPQKENIYNLPDVAICLPPAENAVRDKILAEVGLTNTKYIVMAPSVVVNQRYGEEKYQALYAGIIQKVAQLSGLPILFVPHTRSLSEALAVDSASDDLNVCKAIMNRSELQGLDLRLIENRYNARELKSVIAGAEYAIGSRYHFLIGAISSAVPSIALGWGHKYKEMFELFGMESFVFEYHEFDQQKILEKVQELNDSKDALKQQLLDALPAVKKESHKNVELAIQLLEKQ